MALKALHTIKTGGKTYAPGDFLPKLSKKDAIFLVENNSAVEAGGGDKVSEYDGEALFEQTDDFHTLKVDELKAVCVYLEIPVSGNKGELTAAIEAAFEVVEDDETETETSVPNKAGAEPSGSETTAETD